MNPVSNFVSAVPDSVLAEVNTRLLVRPNDIDGLGHVNNAVVLEYLDAGRWAWLAHNAFPRPGRIAPVVARIEIDYRREILPGEVTVTTTLQDPVDLFSHSYERFKCIFRQTVTQENASVIAAEARVYMAFVDLQDRVIRCLQDYLKQSAEESSAGLEGLHGVKK